MFVLIGRAAASLGRHAWLYGLLAVATVAIQAIAYHFWHANATLEASELVVTSLASAVVYAATKSDVDATETTTLWPRALERGWAVIAISFVQQFVIGYGLAGIFQGDVLDRVLGVAVLVMGLTLLFADIDAVVNDDDTWWLLIPRAFSNSIRAAWSGSTMVRVIGLFLAQYALQQLGLVVRAELQSMHVADATFWATIPLDALLLVPFGIVTVLVYFDAIGYESTRACSE